MANHRRSKRDSIRWGTGQPSTLPKPTPADLAAEVWHQTWTAPGSGVSNSFDVLALDADMAHDLGWMRMAEHGADPSTLKMTQALVPEASVERVVSILRTEGVEANDARQQEYARRKQRQEDGPSDDELANGHGVEGGIPYDTTRAWEQR